MVEGYEIDKDIIFTRIEAQWSVDYPRMFECLKVTGEDYCVVLQCFCSTFLADLKSDG